MAKGLPWRTELSAPSAPHEGQMEEAEDLHKVCGSVTNGSVHEQVRDEWALIPKGPPRSEGEMEEARGLHRVECDTCSLGTAAAAAAVGVAVGQLMRTDVTSWAVYCPICNTQCTIRIATLHVLCVWCAVMRYTTRFESLPFAGWPMSPIFVTDQLT